MQWMHSWLQLAGRDAQQQVLMVPACTDTCLARLMGLPQGSYPR